MTALADGRGADSAAPVRPDVPVRAAGVELLGAHPGSGYRVPPALVRRSDGQVLQLTPLLYAVLSAVDGSRTDEQIAALVSPAIGREVRAEDVRTLVDRRLRPLGVLRLADGSEPDVRKANPLLALRFRYVVSAPERTRTLTAPFAALFNPLIVTIATLGFAAVAYWVLFHKGLASAADQAFADPGMLLAVFAITLVSAGFHEFGHAAALRRGGGTPGAMGAGLYLVWPAFYTDVTDSYRLGRRERLRTDLGGLYFNALIALVTFGVWAVVRWDGLLLVIATQILQMLRQLPPMLRFDGYHLLADITGVPDLFHRIKPTLKGLWPTHWRSPEATALKPWARTIVALWVVLVVPLMLLTALITVLTLPRVIATAAHSFATQWTLLTGYWHAGHWTGVAAKVLALIAVAIPVLGVCYIVSRLVRQVVTATLRRTAGKPIQRTGAAVLAAVIVAALAWAWWPHGNYRVIQPGERGVLQQALSPAALTSTVMHLDAVQDNQLRQGPSQVRDRQLHAGDRATATTVWPTGAPLPTPGHPRLVMVLTPRDPSKPTWVFPFNRPPAPGPGGNQAMAIATKDNSTVYDVAFALVYADKDTVLNRNEAYAFASCSRCTAVAISFQVVLIVGNAHVVAPQNISAAVNYNCIRCLTEALAIQLDVSLPGKPDASTVERLNALWAQLRAFGRHLQGLTFAQIQATLRQFEQRILQIVGPYAQTRTGPAPSGGAAASPGAPASTTPTAVPTSGAAGQQTQNEPAQSNPPASQPPTAEQSSDGAGASTSGPAPNTAPSPAASSNGP